ncbi:MAG TPA: glycoside hydrolase family 9 protein [Thermoanaerobaculia bacterium]
MLRRLVLLAVLLSSLAVTAQSRRRAAVHPCPALPVAPASSPYAVRFDQLGYAPDGERYAVVVSDGKAAPRYRIVDAESRCDVTSGVAGPRVVNAIARTGDRLTADRLELGSLGPGSYLVVLQDGSRFGPIHVRDRAYESIVPLLMRFMAVQRCGPTNPATSQHGACHLFSSITDGDPATAAGDGIVVPYGTRVFTGAGEVVNVEGGWHDAGDYLKFAGTTSFVLVLDLLALRDHDFAGADAVRHEMRWGLEWLLKMIDRPEPLLQVGAAGDHDRNRLPEEDTLRPLTDYLHRPVVKFQPGAGRNLLARAAAAFALASQVYPEERERYLAAAFRAYDAARSRQRAQSHDPYYSEQTTDDDFAFAAAVLARATGEPRYRGDALLFARRINPNQLAVIDWSDLGTLALSETALLYTENSPERRELAGRLTELLEPFVNAWRRRDTPAGPYGVVVRSLGNGSSARILGSAAAAMAANRVIPSRELVEIARAQLHWLFGLNPFGLSFVVGAGQQWPRNAHHQLTLLRGIQVPGAVIGGPTARDELRNSPGRSGPYARWSTEDVLFEDLYAQYVLTEPAIDFHAPLIFVLAELGGR